VKGRDFPIVLVGNKADLPPEKRVISLEQVWLSLDRLVMTKDLKHQGQKYAQEQNLYFEETSARTGQNVEKAFNALGNFSGHL
jgi:GTPase SAR1 family protein